MYAIIKTGGKQYKVAEGNTIKVEHVACNPGDNYTFEDVTLVENDGQIKTGKPFLKGAKVQAECVTHGRGRKLVVFFYRHKTNHKRRKGHRQQYTQFNIKNITLEA